MKYKLLVTDIDGTLMPALAFYINPQTLDGIRRVRELGVKVAIATGRCISLAGPKALSGLCADYTICVNGACVVDGDRHPLFESFFTKEEFDRLERFVDENNAMWNMSYLDGYYVFNRYRECVDEYFRDIMSYNPVIEDEVRARTKRGLPYGGFVAVDPEKAERFNALDPTLKLVPYSVGNYDVMKKTMDKSVGVKALAESIGIDPSEIVAIGDSYNDVEMLSFAGFSVAMGTAPEPVKSAANLVTGSVAEDGVLYALKTIFGI